MPSISGWTFSSYNDLPLIETFVTQHSGHMRFIMRENRTRGGRNEMTSPLPPPPHECRPNSRPLHDESPCPASSSLQSKQHPGKCWGDTGTLCWWLDRVLVVIIKNCKTLNSFYNIYHNLSIKIDKRVTIVVEFLRSI